jgi:glycosyltransferase involved in cell wall biosynthesis
MRTALAHDYLLVMRGAERTFAAMADAWESADIFTLLYDAPGTNHRFAGHRVTSSYLQSLHLRQHNFRRALPLFPRAAKSLATFEYDVLVSSSSAFAHGMRIAPGATHVCYCHSPFRYAWHERRRACSEVPSAARPALNRMLDRIQRWDYRAAQEVTHYVANSEGTRRRIADYYGRDSVVLHPPVEVDRFWIEEPEDYALMVGEIVRHKRVAVALEAAKRAGQRIKVVGTGPDLAALKAEYGDTAEFLGRVSDEDLAGLYARARMFVMANVEEFGIAAVEAQASGRPVVAAAAGGALDTVLPGETGVLVPEDDIDAFAEVLRYTDFDRFSPQVARRNALRFSADAFRAGIRREVSRALGDRLLVPEPAVAVA